MGMYGLTSLSETFGGKIMGLHKPMNFSEGEVSTRINEPSNPFKGEMSILPKTSGFENTIMSLKGKGLNNGGTLDIESKIFGNLKFKNNFVNPIKQNGNKKQFGGFEQMMGGIKNKGVGFEQMMRGTGSRGGFEQAVFGNRVGGGQIFNNFIARNRSTKMIKTPVGKLQVINIPKGSNSPVPAQIVQN